MQRPNRDRMQGGAEMDAIPGAPQETRKQPTMTAAERKAKMEELKKRQRDARHTKLMTQGMVCGLVLFHISD